MQTLWRLLATRLDQHPAWMGLGWSARGMAWALMTRLAGAEAHERMDVVSIDVTTVEGVRLHGGEGGMRNKGTLPNDPARWRAVLGLPGRDSVTQALTKSVAGRGMRGGADAVDIAWTEAWLPELMTWFHVIDAAFVAKRPEYAEHIGRVWHPLLDLLNQEALNQETAARAGTDTARANEAGSGRLAPADAPGAPSLTGPSAQTGRGRRARPPAVVEGGLPSDRTDADRTDSGVRAGGGRDRDESASKRGRAGAARVTGSPAARGTRGARSNGGRANNTGATDAPGAWDYPPLRYSLRSLRACWDAPLPAMAQSHLWDTATAYLAGNDTDSVKTHRALVGKLIKEFGEKAVAQALGEVMTRPQRPADPVAFLRKTLTAQVVGRPSVVAARAQRARVPL